jgi:tRNA-uridine 2-sulfurtransferase
MDKNINKRRVVVGLSGGVDSAVSALLLKKQGYDVTGVYIVCWNEPGCRAEQDRKDALQTALELKIPFKVLDFRKEYKAQVMEYFYDEYENGRTPNPDILCNSVVKFGLFYEWSLENGFDYVATGHYSRIKDGKLYAAKDLKKDQSYFLYRLKQVQLGHIIFPVGDLLKADVRKIAKENKLSVAKKKDSMGICFVGDVNVKELLKKRFGKKDGKVVLSDGSQIGEHDGYWFFNVGLRGRFKFKFDKNSHTSNLDFSNLPKLYVIRIDKDKNEVVVGKREECMRGSFEIEDCHWIGSDPSTACFQTENRSAQDDKADLKSLLALSNKKRVFIKIRNTGEFLKVSLEKVDEDKYIVKLKKKVFGVSPGQSCVIYKKDNDMFEMIGGGVIE